MQCINDAKEFDKQFKLQLSSTLMEDTVYDNELTRFRSIVKRDNLLKPWPHQEMFVPLFHMRRRNLLCWSMGSGKTLTALYTLYMQYESMWDKLRPNTVMVVAPTYNICTLVWYKQLKLLGLQKYAAVVNSTKDLDKNAKPIIICTYSFLTRQSAKGLALKRNKFGFRAGGFVGIPIWKQLIQSNNNPSFLIADEVHKLMNVKTGRSKSLRELSKRANRVLGLSGSPLDGYMSSLAGVLSFIYGENSVLFPYTVRDFDNTFSQTISTRQDFRTGGTNSGKLRKLPGVKASKLSHYFEVVKPLIHRLTDADPLISAHVTYPSENRQKISVAMTDMHAEVYKTSRDIVRRLKTSKDSPKYSADALVEINLIKKLSNCPWDVINTDIRPKDIGKYVACRELIAKHLEQGDKGIVYVHQVAVGKALYDYLKDKLGIQIARIYATDEKYSKPASMSLLNREQEIIRFQDDDEVKLLIANTELCSDGLDLVEASYGIFFDYGWRSIVLEQAARRYARPGQLKPDTYTYYLEHLGTVDTYVLDNLLAKCKLNNSVLDLEFNALMWENEFSSFEPTSDIALIADRIIADYDTESV